MSCEGEGESGCLVIHLAMLWRTCRATAAQLSCRGGCIEGEGGKGELAQPTAGLLDVEQSHGIVL